MSFLKSLLLAILATLFLTFVFGSSLLGLFDVNVTMNGEVVKPLQTIALSTLIGVTLVVVAIAIALCVFGSLLFVTLIGIGCVAMLTVGVFWPILLMAIVIWLLSRNTKPATRAESTYTN